MLSMFIPVGIISGILFAITLLLILADRLLVSYGECKILFKTEDDEKEFTVHGGTTLLSALITNNIKISAPCGGRGSCGYCKVQLASGGGSMLPTEEIFISKEEEEAGTRLACQVKVKEDLEIFIPDLITSVKSMVKNKSFDTSLDWKFILKNEPDIIFEDKKPEKLKKKDKEIVEDIVSRYSNTAGPMMPILQEINEHYKYLPEPVLKSVAEQTDTPLSKVYRIATFYNAFSLKPRGKYQVSICTGTACHVKGSADILAAFEEELNIKSGETTEDMHFTLDAVRCIGCCGLAPVLTINEDVHGLLTVKKVKEIIDIYRGK